MIDVKTVSCMSCVHHELCKYEDDHMKIIEAVKKVTADQPCSDGKLVHLKPISSFDFVDDIFVKCKYYCCPSSHFKGLGGLEN